MPPVCVPYWNAEHFKTDVHVHVCTVQFVSAYYWHRTHVRVQHTLASRAVIIAHCTRLHTHATAIVFAEIEMQIQA